jgi:hypothetical protein
MNGPNHEGSGAPHIEEAQHVTEEPVLDDAADAEISKEEAKILATVATVGVVGVGVAVFEAALLPGVVLGVAAMAAPKLLPRVGSALNPVFRSTVRGIYKIGQKTKEMVHETHEQVQDIVAEVDAEAKHDAGQDVAEPAPKA